MQYNRGYLLGRLLVVLAKQNALEAAPEQVYQQAFTVPAQVFPKALAALFEAGKEENVRTLLKLLPVNTFDGGLNRREQGAFAIGYSHELAGYTAPLEEEHDDGEEADLTDRYELRVDPGLKEWIKARGGGTFVRSMLRTERARQE
jgi:CRISPR-associated protein (Cas_Csd1)